jgi:2'-5' RNA ligase
MNKWYKIYKMATAAKEQEYGWTSIATPKSIGNKTIGFANSIPERELFTKEDDEKEWGYGVEDDPHITVLWGIQTKDAKKVQKALQEQKGGTVKLGKIGMFETDEYDVLKVDIISQSLRRINGHLKSELKHASTHPDYNPHITLAYLKCGNGEKYIKDKRFEGLTFEFNEIIFEDSDDKSTTIQLID